MKMLLAQESFVITFLFFTLLLMTPACSWLQTHNNQAHRIRSLGGCGRSCRESTYKNMVSNIHMSESDGEQESSNSITKWSNPSYSSEQLKQWWDSIDRALISVGTKGVQQSHVNSLLETLKSHERVKVKLASDRMNSVDTATTFMNNDMLKNNAELLECRKREIMVGRTASTPVQPIKIGKTRDQSWFKQPKK